MTVKKHVLKIKSSAAEIYSLFCTEVHWYERAQSVLSGGRLLISLSAEQPYQDQTRQYFIKTKWHLKTKFLESPANGSGQGLALGLESVSKVIRYPSVLASLPQVWGTQSMFPRHMIRRKTWTALANLCQCHRQSVGALQTPCLDGADAVLNATRYSGGRGSAGGKQPSPWHRVGTRPGAGTIASSPGVWQYLPALMVWLWSTSPSSLRSSWPEISPSYWVLEENVRASDTTIF